MNIAAKDKSTGKENKITIKSDSGLTQEEIERMVKDAEANAESDKKQRELIDARNSAEGQLHNLRKDLEEHGDKITAEEKSTIEEKIKDLETAVAGDSVESINEGTTKLWESVKPLLDKKMEAEQQKAQDKEDGVVDAELKEVKEV